FRFATVVATVLFFLTFGINALAPQLAQAPALAFGGAAASEAPASAQQAPVMEAAATEATATDATLEAAANLEPLATAMPPSEDSARVAETPMTKIGEAENAGGLDQTQVASESPRPAPLIPSVWQTAFAVVALVGVSLMALLRRSSANRWK